MRQVEDLQELKGKMKIDLKVEGPTGAPRVSGGALIEGESYENLRTGTLLKDLILEVQAEGQRLSIARAQAGDGQGGSITMQGGVDLVGEKGFPFSLEVAFDHSRLLRNDHFTVSGDGRVKLAGSIQDMSLAGRFQVEQAEIRIPDRLPPDITDLEVIEVNRPEGDRESQPRPGPSPPRRIKLDLTVSSPGKIFVTGRGLESEWEGELLVAGSAAEPAVSGGLSVVRGRLNFLGKRFALKKGRIIFDGAVPPAPRVEATAEARAKDITAIVQLSGPASAPEVKLSSDPALPSDEILAHLLFGRSLSTITPLQALQLADAVRSLSGGRGLDLAGRARKALGVDQLEVKPADDENSETRVSAGKYLSDRVYLEVEKGMGSEPGEATVQVEVTPNLSVETEVGEDAEAGVGIRWKWDY